jgi:hypothetical protein
MMAGGIGQWDRFLNAIDEGVDMAVLLKELQEQFVRHGQIKIPEKLSPPAEGFRIVSWTRELVAYYRAEGVTGRALADLPGIGISGCARIRVTVQDVHEFVISDRNLLPLEVKRRVVEACADSGDASEVWKKVKEIVVGELKKMAEEDALEELSLRYSAVGEVVGLVTWFSLERLGVRIPKGTMMVAERFPYYWWAWSGSGEVLEASLWEPEEPTCRVSWLILDVYRSLLGRYWR